ncbi:MAG: acetyl-CoA C-acyltransferase, partial [Steroidobacteraceae bacterium]
AIAIGEQDLAIAGGVESMSRAPLVLHKASSAFDRTQSLEDTTMGWRFINPQMKALYGVDSMPQTAENLARQFGISRADQDAFALRSQLRAGVAQVNGFFSEEIVPVLVPGKKRGETVEVTRDESLRADTTLEGLAKLKPLFEDGTVTAGNASGINDGAAALLLASESAVRRFGLQPRARVLGMATAGVEPRIMGIGPVPATQKLLRRLKLKLSDFDAIEINEAFAGQVLSCLREFELSPDHHSVNPNGGAIALGHPLGMSGVRLAATVVHQLQRTGSRLGLATMCIGVGQGIALAVERC